jgi:predicted nucleotidyltransferase
LEPPVMAAKNPPLLMKELICHLNFKEIPFLLIGGRGLEAHGYVRNTKDVDLLISLQSKDAIATSLRELEYACIAETAIFSRWRSANPISDDVDLLYVDPGTYAKLASDAITMDFGSETVSVPSLLGMIALKLHAIRNNPERRHRDVSDIRAVIELHRNTIHPDEIQSMCERYGPPGIFNDLNQDFE